MKAVRVLPIFILIAFLSLSVRVVQVIDGVVMLSGDAYAEGSLQGGGARETPHDVAMNDDHGMSDEKAEDSGVAKPFGSHDDFPVWKDPVEDDPSYEASRMEVLKDLSKRREDLVKRERVLETREALLKAAEQEIDQKYQELDQLRAKLENLLQTQSDEEKERIASLVKVYEGMKPKDAARIFDTLDLDILVQVVAQMSERKLSPVLAAMNPERARTITIMLAEQKQLPSLP